MISWRLNLLLLPLCWLLLGAASPPHKTTPVKPEALAHFRQGQQLFLEKHYADAAKELAAGYALDPRTEYLYALGQAYRLAGQCDKAIEVYKKYLRSTPGQRQLAATQKNIERCEVELLARDRTPDPRPVEIVRPEPNPVPESGLATSTSLTSKPKATPVYKKWWFWTSIGVVVAAGVGVGLGLGLSRTGFSSTIPDVCNGGPCPQGLTFRGW